MSNEKIDDLTYKTSSKLLYNQLIRLDENTLTALLPKEVTVRHTPCYHSAVAKVGSVSKLLINGNGVYYISSNIPYNDKTLIEKCYMYSKGSPTDCLGSVVISMILLLLKEGYVEADAVYSEIERKNYLSLQVGRHYKFTNNESGRTLEGVVIYNSKADGMTLAHVSFIGVSLNQAGYFGNPYPNNDDSDYKIEEIKNEQ